jgi:hypothetical protein
MSASAWKINPSRPSPGWLVLIGPYDPEFVESLKAAIPAADREWYPVLKGWKFRESHRGAVEALIERHS